MIGFRWVRHRIPRSPKKQQISKKIYESNIWLFLIVVEKQESTVHLVSEQLSFSVVYDVFALSRSSYRETVTAGSLKRLHIRATSPLPRLRTLGLRRSTEKKN